MNVGVLDTDLFDGCDVVVMTPLESCPVPDLSHIRPDKKKNM